MNAQTELAKLALASLSPTERAALLRELTPALPRRRLGTRRDVAAILGIHAGSVQRYERRGDLQPIRVSARRIRFDLDAAERLANYGAGQVIA
jgi:hypothetical protein